MSISYYQPASGAPPLMPLPQPPAPPRRWPGVLAGVVAAVLCAVPAGFVGAELNRPAEPTSVQAAGPSGDEIRAETIDLCTRFATGYNAMTDVQRGPADVIGVVNYIAAAAAENPVADSQIRSAVTESVRLLRVEAAWLSHEPAAGAIQPPVDPQTSQGKVADQAVWDQCRAWRG